MLSFFPRDVLDALLNLTESVSEGFPTYSCDCAIFTFLTYLLKSPIVNHLNVMYFTIQLQHRPTRRQNKPWIGHRRFFAKKKAFKMFYCFIFSNYIRFFVKVLFETNSKVYPHNFYFGFSWLFFYLVVFCKLALWRPV